MNEKRYYWLKLEETYFDLKIQKALRKLPSGSDMLICYLKMQLKYLNKGGLIEYQGIYDDLAEEVALDIDEEVDLVKMTLSILQKWKVIEPCENGIYIAEMQERIGSKSDVALRVAKHREKQKMLHCNTDVTKSNSIKEIELEKDIEIDIDKKEINKEKRFTKPTIEEIENYCKERNNSINAVEFYNFYESKNWFIGKNKMKNWKSAIVVWEQREKKDTSKKKKWYEEDYWNE